MIQLMVRAVQQLSCVGYVDRSFSKVWYIHEKAVYSHRRLKKRHVLCVPGEASFHSDLVKVGCLARTIGDQGPSRQGPSVKLLKRFLLVVVCSFKR